MHCLLQGRVASKMCAHMFSVSIFNTDGLFNGTKIKMNKNGPGLCSATGRSHKAKCSLQGHAKCHASCASQQSRAGPQPQPQNMDSYGIVADHGIRAIYAHTSLPTSAGLSSLRLVCSRHLHSLGTNRAWHILGSGQTRIQLSNIT